MKLHVNRVSRVSKYIDIAFLLKFLLIFIPLYYFHIAYLGITDPKNYYSPFLDHYLNYISWITQAVLVVASYIDHAFGLRPIVVGNVIEVVNGASVALAYECVGLGIMSFWTAFVVAHKSTWTNKLKWVLLGYAIIYVINCFRIAVLLLALQDRWKATQYIDHHDMFNLVAYTFILILIMKYNRSNEKMLAEKRTVELSKKKSSFAQVSSLNMN